MDAHEIEIQRRVSWTRLVTNPERIKEILAAITHGEEVEYFVASPGSAKDTIILYDDQGQITHSFRIAGGGVMSDGEKHYQINQEAYQRVIKSLVG